MCEHSFERVDSDIGSYENYCNLQKKIIDEASDEDIQFWVMVNNKFVGSSGMVDKETMNEWTTDEFYLNYDNENVRVVFFHEQ